jgi:diacylglycerol kinase
MVRSGLATKHSTRMDSIAPDGIGRCRPAGAMAARPQQSKLRTTRTCSAMVRSGLATKHSTRMDSIAIACILSSTLSPPRPNSGAIAVTSAPRFMFTSRCVWKASLGLPLLALAWWIAPSRWKALAMSLSMVADFVVDLLNSAIEALVDAVSLEAHPLIKRAKDIGSAAMMLSIAGAALVWIVALV